MRIPDTSSGLEAKWQVAEDIKPVNGVCPAIREAKWRRNV